MASFGEPNVSVVRLLLPLMVVVVLQQHAADALVAGNRLQQLEREVAERQSQLVSVNNLINDREQCLQKVAADLAKKRGDLSTAEGGLSASLRQKADAEYQALEQALSRWDLQGRAETSHSLWVTRRVANPCQACRRLLPLP